MSAIVLYTLDFAAKLRAGGFSEQQAETQARALAEVLERHMASKAELAEHESQLTHAVREAELRLEAKLAETKAELVRWVVGAGVLQTTLIVAVVLKASGIL